MMKRSVTEASSKKKPSHQLQQLNQRLLSRTKLQLEHELKNKSDIQLEYGNKTIESTFAKSNGQQLKQQRIQLN